MDKRYINGYVKGIAEMASELSGVSGPSSMTAQVFSVRSLDSELAEAFGGEPDLVEMEPSEVTLM